MFGRTEPIEIKSVDELALMREAGLVVARTLELLRRELTPGMTTADLDALARDSITGHGATSSFLGYHGFPAVICTSVNREVVHGIPGDTEIRAGDIVSIDCGAIIEGWHGDAAISVVLPDPEADSQVDPELARLSESTKAALWAGVAAAKVGGRLSDIGHAVETAIRSSGDYGIVEDYVGHGIGSAMHMHPPVPNYGKPGRGPRLEAGMALAIEPMVTVGSPHVEVLADGWTVITRDGGAAAHWEHTVALTDEGPWVLTSLEGTRL
ncbi:MAG: type I methionyl aminopeptidase [Candidatus Nanopelagicales bacterium]